MQVHRIPIKQQSLADMLLRGQFTKIADKYPFLQIAQSIFGTLLKAGIYKYLLNECQLDCSDIA